MSPVINIVLLSFVVLLALSALLIEYKRDLMMLQQNSYRINRYMRWLRISADTTSTPRIIAMLVALLALAQFAPRVWAAVIIGVFSAGSALVLFKAKYKKPLAWTRRARRIYAVQIVVSIIIMGVALLLMQDFSSDFILYAVGVMLLMLYCGSHIVTVIAVWILTPVERMINRRYYREAEAILRSMPTLKVIGVTGSYGKTSTKHYLHRILSEKYDVLMTPGSFNTTLGVIRTVREYMKPYTEVFICEMGAKQPGDIKEICDLVHPSIGIVTAVGPQHLESFKTIENVQRTKFELIDSLPADGLAVVNNDFPFVASREVGNVECRRYAVSATDGASFTATDITYTPTGTKFTILGAGEPLTLHTRLVGECNVSNLIAAVIVALYLDVPREKISYAVAKIEQVEHRLNMKRTAAGVTIIDDAFNSNPTGSAMALDVLASMTSGKRIVVTPGMIELGDQQYRLNADFGRKIASTADVAIVVGGYNRDAIVEGIESAEDSSVAVHTVASFAEAQSLLSSILSSGDTVLYENDLPDTFK